MVVRVRDSRPVLGVWQWSLRAYVRKGSFERGGQSLEDTPVQVPLEL